MKRFVLGVLALLVAAAGYVQPAAASVNDFRFSSFEADYYLGADNEGRSTLKTIEKLTAEFDIPNQNHGIERAIPKKYDGHTTNLKLESVVDASGRTLPYETYDSNDNLVVRIGDKNSYVNGSMTYVITYTQRDVTKYFANTGSNEFYWDTNGLLWQQPFGRVSATVHLSDRITPTFKDKVGCYYGREGSTTQCQVSVNGDTVSASVENLKANENMTIAVGFTPGTFRGYEPSLWERIVGIWGVTLVVTSIIGFIAIFWLSFRYAKFSNRSKEIGPIAPQYIPPKNTTVPVAAQVGDGTRADTTATLIDLAVRNYITVSQTKEKSLFQSAEYELTIVKSIQSLSAEERDFVSAMFGDAATGTTLATKTLKSNYSLYTTLNKNTQKLTKRIKGEYGLRAKDDGVTKKFYTAGHVLLVIGLLGLSPMMLIAAAVAYGCGTTIRPLTDSGLELRRYLAGLKMYIEMAEKDRLAALQSPEGAEKTGVKIGSETDKKLIKLYERTLPYAILFGQEKEWNRQLAVQYENSGVSPSWYSGHAAFNAAVFTSAMNDFSGSMNSYSASSSSSSGGSSGGGSSGGGGGGGGGGGW